MPTPDLSAAAEAVEAARAVIKTALRHLAGQDDAANQVVAYDLAHAAAGVETAAAVLEYGALGEEEAALATAFAADAVYDVMARSLSREPEWGLEPGALDAALPFVREHRDPAFVASLARRPGPRHLDEDFEMVQETFRRF